MAGLGETVLSGSVVDGQALLDTAIASVIAGVGVTLIASAAIYGFAMTAEMRREERGVASAAAATLAIVASLAFTALIVAAFVVMIGP